MTSTIKLSTIDSETSGYWLVDGKYIADAAPDYHTGQVSDDSIIGDVDQYGRATTHNGQRIGIVTDGMITLDTSDESFRRVAQSAAGSATAAKLGPEGRTERAKAGAAARWGSAAREARQIIARFERVELSAAYAPDARRVIRDERFSLLASLDSGRDEAIRACITEARRVAEMWNVSL